MLAILIQRYDKKSFHLKNERLTEILQAVRCHIFMIVSIPYINLLNISWIIECLFLRNMEHLKGLNTLSRGFPHFGGQLLQFSVLLSE